MSGCNATILTLPILLLTFFLCPGWHSLTSERAVAEKRGPQGGRAMAAQQMHWSEGMSKRDELIAKYADDLRKKCKMEPDMALLTKVTIGCGPAIYNTDSETVAAAQPSELETIKANFLIKKLGLSDTPKLMEAINAGVETYGKSDRNKCRAVVYCMLVKHFGKEGVYA
jgi:hypothetical protein